MKHFLLFILFISILKLNAQLPVNQAVESKNVVLEEFTGIHCVYCPDGHRIAQQLQDNHPGDVVLINVHTGSFAAPNPGEPDFRTTFGSSLATQSQLAGYPSGTVNRHYFGYSQSGSPSGATALNRNQWTTAANTILGETSYCNVALEAAVDVQTREMVVDVEVYYTSNSPVSSNFINVALLQNNVEGPQVGSANNPDQVLPNGNYNHMHMLRHLLTGQWGDEVTTTTQGTLIQRQYTYTLPTDINGVPLELGNLEIAAFVAEGHQEIITGNLGVINYTNFYNVNVGIEEVIFNDEICSPDDLEPAISVNNNGLQEITTLTIEYNVNGGTNEVFNWSGSISSLETKTIVLPNFNFVINTTNTLNVQLVSINGNTTDDNTNDNQETITFNKTNNQGQGSDYIVTIVQDQYGSETTWAIRDENNNYIATGGPYSDLSGSGTVTHNHNVSLNNDGCYTFVILDSYGDGINGGYGSGNYSLKQADGTTVFYRNGVFASEEITYFEVNNANAIDEVFSTSIRFYPNPGTGLFTVDNIADTLISIYNMQGTKVFEIFSKKPQIQLDISHLSNGVYLVRFEKNNKTGVKKIVITK